MLSRRTFVVATCAGALAQVVAASITPPLAGYTFRFEMLEQGVVDASGNGRIDMGALTARAGTPRSRRIFVQRRIAIRVNGPGDVARVSVSLAQDVPGCALHIDGLLITSIPRVIDPIHRVNTAVMHVLELEVPPEVAPGSFLADLRWEAEPL